MRRAAYVSSSVQKTGYRQRSFSAFGLSFWCGIWKNDTRAGADASRAVPQRIIEWNEEIVVGNRGLIMGNLIGSSIIAILQNLIASFLAVVLGIGFTQLVRSRWDEHLYGRWHVIIKNKKEIKVNRAISVRKAKEILDDPADLSVFLKGIVSPYALLNCDIIEEGDCRGLLIRDSVNRQFIVDLDNNPPHEGSSARPVL